MVIEKHFTIDKELEGPDHKASITPNELSLMVSSIRLVETALGKNEKVPTQSEINNLEVARKSIVAIGDIKIGEIFTTKNIGIKRPGGGCSPYSFWSVLGSNADRSYKTGEKIVI